MALFKNTDLLLPNARRRIGEMALDIVKNRENGFDESNAQKDLKLRLMKCVKLFRALMTRSEFADNGDFVGIYNIEDTQYNKILRALIKIGNVQALPVTNKILYRGHPYIRVAGGPGPQGNDGEDSFTYIGYATDGAGSGFAITPDPTRKYIALRNSNVPLVVVAAIFSGLWGKYLGEDGATGAAGADGTSKYVFIGYADDAAGTGFTLTFNVSKAYIAFLVKSVDVPPLVAEFAGTWARYLGTNGTNGTDGKTIHSGTGVPPGGLGVDGDYYIDNNAPKTIYGPKTAGAWGAGTSIVGPAGATGADGVTGAPGADGTNAFLYIAYADDAAGTGFTLIFDPNKNWIAIKQTSTLIPSPVVGDFAGLFTKYQGDGDRWNTTSTTSLTIGTGVQNLVVDLNLAYSTGQKIVIALDGDEDNRMEGYVRSYDPTTGQMVVDIDNTVGAGTYAVWDVNLFGVPVQVITTDSYFGEINVENGAAAQALSTSYAKISQFNADGAVSPGVTISNANDNITPTVRGAYKCVADLSVSGDTAGMEVIFALFKNGTVIAGTQSRIILAAATDIMHVSIESIQDLNASDVIDVRAKSVAGTPNLLVEDGRLAISTTGSPSSPDFTIFSNPDVDTGTEDADTFLASLAYAVIWDCVIRKGTARRKITLEATWEGTNLNYSQSNPTDLNGPIDITLSADVNAGNVRLRATATSDDWIVSGNRTLIK
jgi:hypothetical protein